MDKTEEGVVLRDDFFDSVVNGDGSREAFTVSPSEGAIVELIVWNAVIDTEEEGLALE